MQNLRPGGLRRLAQEELAFSWKGPFDRLRRFGESRPARIALKTFAEGMMVLDMIPGRVCRIPSRIFECIRRV